MLVQTSCRSLWPVIFFLPWVLLSAAYLVAWLLHRRVFHRHSRLRVPPRGAKQLSIIGLSLLLGAASLARAEPANEEPQGCPVSTEEAHLRADRLFEAGSYRAAGECYLEAGDYPRANHAFLKAVGPASAATEHRVSDQRQQAKLMLRNLQRALPSHP